MLLLTHYCWEFALAIMNPSHLTGGRGSVCWSVVMCSHLHTTYFSNFHLLHVCVGFILLQILINQQITDHENCWCLCCKGRVSSEGRTRSTSAQTLMVVSLHALRPVERNPQHCPLTGRGLFAFSSQMASVPRSKTEAGPGSQQVSSSRKQSRCAFGP